MLKKEVEAVLFDLDGVLIDSKNYWFHVFNDTRLNFGLKKISKNEFGRIFGISTQNAVKKYFVGKTVDEIVQSYRKDFKKRISCIKLNQSSIPALEKLKGQGIKLCIITNSPKFMVSSILGKFGLKKYFDAVITMEDVKKSKPAPDMALKACKILKVRPKGTILVGDTKNDMIAGKRAGCTTVGYKVKGDYEINDLNCVLSILK